MKIAKLELENVKRVRAVTIEPKMDGLTVIGGKNDQGKTSVLDAIAWALGGEKYRPSSAARDDSVIPPRLEVHMDNGIIVTREGKNGTLKVIDPSGKRGGQQLLDQFVEKLALDLPRFMEASGKEKARTLLQIIGMEKEVKELDDEENSLYNRRHALGQIADQKAKYAAEMIDYPDAPKELISPSDLLEQQQNILKRNAEIDMKRQQILKLKNQIEILAAKRVSIQERIDELKDQYKEVDSDLQEVRDDLDEACEEVKGLKEESTEELERNIRDVEEINAKVRANMDKEKALQEASECAGQYSELSEKIEEVRKKRTDLLNSARLPLPELAVEQGELLYKGKKWDCMSSSEQVRVSTAIVKALNPECKFVLLDKLEQLDLDTLKDFGEWLEEEGLQAICTRVSMGAECEIIITDGVSVENKPEPTAPAWKAGEF